MRIDECCNQNCNQGRDCPKRSLSEKITEGFKALKTMRNNKPVAWIDYLKHSDLYDLNVSGRGIPLYTHPAKTLTDEEIMECFKKVNLFTAHMVDVARAILRKAQEK